MLNPAYQDGTHAKFLVSTSVFSANLGLEILKSRQIFEANISDFDKHVHWNSRLIQFRYFIATFITTCDNILYAAETRIWSS